MVRGERAAARPVAPRRRVVAEPVPEVAELARGRRRGRRGRVVEPVAADADPVAAPAAGATRGRVGPGAHHAADVRLQAAPPRAVRSRPSTSTPPASGPRAAARATRPGPRGREAEQAPPRGPSARPSAAAPPAPDASRPPYVWPGMSHRHLSAVPRRPGPVERGVRPRAGAPAAGDLPPPARSPSRRSARCATRTARGARSARPAPS